jgi:tRNA/tmRNA/rRNA uracil-C5-methylase (TrmA/RlmC/RlmD family)
VSDLLQLRIGAPAHGGHCVARDPDGRVVFVRHALPGELVGVRITDDAGSFRRADAVEVLEASPDRVTPPCPHAGPGRCGGCDWQHASGSAQRAMKAAVIREQLARLAGLDIPVTVEELPGGLLGWRTRIQYAIGRDGTVGLRRHRSHEVEPIDACPLGVRAVSEPPPARPSLTGIEVAQGDDGEPALLGHSPGAGRQARGRRPPDRVELLAGPPRLRHIVAGRTLEVDAAGFWQVHPHAASTFAAALLDLLRPQPGERVLDLYAGAGLFTALLASAVGAEGKVLGIEASRQAVADAEANLADLPQARVVRARVTPDVIGDADLVVLDPPRSGAGREVMTAVLARAPRAVGYVACDPAALARDLRVAVDSGWRLAELRAFDAFPMTHHVECLALIMPDQPGGSAGPSRRSRRVATDAGGSATSFALLTNTHQPGARMRTDATGSRGTTDPT